jgi:YD repeat-containing protein
VSVLLLFASTGVPAEKKELAPAPSAWEKIETAMGSIAMDGTLRLSCDLAESAELRILGVRCRLVHRIETDARGEARSAWKMEGLNSVLVPEGRDSLVWHPLGGVPVKFDRAKIGRALAAAGSIRWLIREFGNAGYEIRSLDGRAWRYEQGHLISAEHPSLGRISIDSRGGRLVSLRRADASVSEDPILLATYDGEARLASVRAAGKTPFTLEWNSSGELIACRGPGDKEIRFSYRHGLLSEIMETGKPARVIGWEANPGHERGDSKWPAPVHLSRDGDTRFAYAMTPKGYVATVHSVSGAVSVTCFNPLMMRVTHRSSAGKYTVTLRRGAGTIERIADGRGDVLEDYRYDEYGQLIGVKREREMDRILDYDETGRLMSVQESGVGVTLKN